MKRTAFILLLLASVLTMRAQTAQPTGRFQTLLEQFSDSTFVTCVRLGGQEVLLVSHETFCSDDSPQREALAATLFTDDGTGHLLCLGSIRSQGTLYPISLLGDTLVTAGHQFVNFYEVKGHPADLYLTRVDEGERLEQGFVQFERATPLPFVRKAKSQD